jgi:hypothetical protein
MSRRIRCALSLLLVSFALSAAACADSTAPTTPPLNAQGPLCDTTNPVTCR